MSGRGRTAVDTNVIVAGLLTWHELHTDAVRALEAALHAAEGLVVPGHAIVEAFSVMTRLPAGKRVAPHVAERLLVSSFGPSCPVGALSSEQIWRLLDRLGKASIGGGAVFDARILAEAEAAGAARLVTHNVRHFNRFETPLEIVPLN